MADQSSKNRGWINWRQGRVLADRYLETTLADWKNTGLLLIQAPVLAAMAAAVWSNVDRATGSLYFVMTLSAFWLGCTDACREIVKERALFLREKAVNLDVGAYLYSKIRVLALLNVVQVVTYAVIIWEYVPVRVPIGWLILNLLATALCGTALGLLISALAPRSDHAVGLVPLVILPQILFSEFAISADQFAGFSKWAYRLMPAGWGFEGLKEFADTSPEIFQALAYSMPPLGFAALFLLLAYPVLANTEY